MESEQMIIPEEACTIVNAASAAGQNICAVGTSVLRAMETASGTQRHLKAFDGLDEQVSSSLPMTSTFPMLW